MIAIIKNIFKANPEASKIVLKGECSNCGRNVEINITPTSGEVGLQSGALLESSPDKYFAKCPDCYTVISLITHHFHLKKTKRRLRAG